MPLPEILLAFFAAAAVFAYMPGPAMVHTAASRRSGKGLLIGLGAHVAAQRA